MNAERRVIELLVSVVVFSSLLVGSVSARGVADVPCDVCKWASDPVQYESVVGLEGSESGVGAASAAPLTIGDIYDPVQYVFSAGRYASLVRDAEIARLRGLAGVGAGSWAGVNEVAHLRGLLEASLSSGAVGVAREAEVARLTGLAEYYRESGEGSSFSQVHEAEIARLRGLAGGGAGSWAGTNEDVHLRGLVDAALSGDAGIDCAMLSLPTRSQTADAARLTGFAEWYLGGGVVRAPRVNRARLAGAARLTAHAAHLGATPNSVPPQIACITVP